MYQMPTVVSEQRIYVTFWTCPVCTGMMPKSQEFAHLLIHR